MNDLILHPMGECDTHTSMPIAGPVAVDTFGGRVHVEWDPQAAVTPLGQLPFFTEFLQVSGLFDPWVASCEFGKLIWPTSALSFGPPGVLHHQVLGEGW